MQDAFPSLARRASETPDRLKAELQRAVNQKPDTGVKSLPDKDLRRRCESEQAESEADSGTCVECNSSKPFICKDLVNSSST